MVLLCQFHLLKFMKNLIATTLATVEIKGEMMAKFKSLVYRSSESLFFDLKKMFVSSIKEIQVRQFFGLFSKKLGNL